MDLLLIIFIAFFVAMIFSMLGLGGAIIYTPLFFWAGLPLQSAIPMALMLNLITTGSASITYLKLRLVDTKMAYPVISASIMGALLGVYLSHIVDTRMILFFLSILLFLAGIRILFLRNMAKAPGKIKALKNGIITGAGFFIGIISSLAGIGGGTFFVPLLLFFGYEIRKATATSAFIITFMALSGFLGHLNFGYEQMDLKMLLFAGIAAFLGAQAGSRFIFKRISSRTIELVFALVLLGVAGRLWYGL